MRHMAAASVPRILAVTVLAGGQMAVRPASAAGDEPAQAERVAVGREAPAFSLTGTDGETYAPSELRGEKNLVLVFFRGTW